MQYFQILVLNLSDLIAWHSGWRSCQRGCSRCFLKSKLLFRVPHQNFEMKLHGKRKTETAYYLLQDWNPPVSALQCRSRELVSPAKAAQKFFCSCATQLNLEKTALVHVMSTCNYRRHKIQFRWILQIASRSSPRFFAQPVRL